MVDMCRWLLCDGATVAKSCCWSRSGCVTPLARLLHAAAAAAAVLQMTQVNGNNSTRRFWARSTLLPDQPEISELS